MLIVFEGIDGSGKTSLCQAVKLRLIEIGLKAIVTSEFGRADDWSVKGKAELLAARNQREQYQAVMSARLAHKRAVLDNTPHSTILLMDRYLPSTIAYQSCQSLPVSLMIRDHELNELPVPEHTFLIDIDPQVAHSRVRHRGEMDKFDSRGPDQFKETHERLTAGLRILDSCGWQQSSVKSDQHLSILIDACVSVIMAKVNAASKEVAA